MISGLLGVNGSGKTTHLLELHRIEPGSFLPDYPTIPIDLTAFELLWRVGKMKRIDNAEQRAKQLCSTLMIDGGFDRPISTYSAGNYKKAAIATLLLERPERLYLDEPLETVDVISREILMDIFQAMSKSGTHISISTQDILLSMRFDHIKVFSHLNVVMEGTPENVLGENPMERFLELSKVTLQPNLLPWLI
ncbi:ATP-binding cassette domain-containing protein [Corynebacterium kutscheri]|uniref:ABC transporter ATP-binding protein n=1 Tax=Corynebacterium kutscheri TaxID=35755 RepID=A0AB38VT73_9CORY|nr:ATP-binding cassette domain-containing protein [Corynebacterium kutscheri]VEH08816.1 ABC transporter ATP-binding protein [Corynebacterium kutscheri]